MDANVKFANYRSSVASRKIGRRWDAELRRKQRDDPARRAALQRQAREDERRMLAAAAKQMGRLP